MDFKVTRFLKKSFKNFKKRYKTIYLSNWTLKIDPYLHELLGHNRITKTMAHELEE